MFDGGAWRSGGLALVFVSSLAVAQEQEPSFDDQVKAYESDLSQFGKWDPLHPRVLATRLDYAGYLAMAADEADCAGRLQRAQAELDKVRATPLTEMLLPSGKASVLAVDYRIHVARAGCTEDEGERSRELGTALESAQQSADAYGQTFDYATMAVMQFNVAHARRLLGDDAAENYGYLLDWRDGASDPEKVQAFADSLPIQNADLKFNWAPFSATGKYQQETAEFASSQILRKQVSVASTSQVRREKDELVISTQFSAPDASLPEGTASDDINQKLSKFLVRAFSSVPDMVVTAQGEFKEVRDVKEFSKRLHKEADVFVEDLVPKDDPRLAEIKRAVDQQLNTVLSPEVIEGKAREAFALDSGMWIDATIEHDLRFAVARWLPCDGKSTAPRCVEIVITATPDEEQVAKVMKAASKSHGGDAAPWEYCSETRHRMITDPATLKTYSRETRQYSYIGASVNGQRSQEIKAERTLYTTSY